MAGGVSELNVLTGVAVSVCSPVVRRVQVHGAGVSSKGECGGGTVGAVEVCV